MSKFLKAVPLTMGAALFFAGAAQADMAFECKFPQNLSNGPWIAENLVVAEQEGMVAVYDNVIHHFHGEPLEARLDTDNDARTTFVWEVKAKDKANQYARIKYRMTIMKSDRTANITAVPQGYADVFTATGRCKKVKV